MISSGLVLQCIRKISIYHAGGGSRINCERSLMIIVAYFTGTESTRDHVRRAEHLFVFLFYVSSFAYDYE